MSRNSSFLVANEQNKNISPQKQNKYPQVEIKNKTQTKK